MTHRKLTTAAGHLGLTQPAVSHALARLRTLLDDELFLRTRSGVEPTPRALEIEAAVDGILAAVAGIVDRPGPFDPAQATGSLRLGMLDSEATLLAARLDAALAKMAPQLRLSIRHTAPEESLRLLREGDLDLGIGVMRSTPAEVVVEELLEDSFAVIARREHPRIRGSVTLPSLTGHDHVEAASQPGAVNPIDAALQRMGQRRRVALTVPYVSMAARVVAESDRIAILPLRVARELSRTCPLQVIAVPLTMPGLSISLAWHRRRTGDRMLEWARRTVVEVLARKSDATTPAVAAIS